MSGINDIRQTFLDFFARHDHQVVKSGSLVPKNDPSLMFTSAGMVQFKNIFTGVEQKVYDRVVTAQKCVRAGGKHNDLENVGYTYRHHTFFEMLGNFSFGDYFKEQAIKLAWDLITKEFALDPDRLIFTVYHDDDTAFDLWKKISGLPEQRIIRIATSDNFWAMGDSGPCGPCSEIFYDHGDDLPGDVPGSAEGEGDRFVEIWNLVFMQYEQLSADKRVNLPRPSIDTGMGLERMAAVLQNTCDNYETDLFKQLIAAIETISQVKADDKHKQSHRVIADHLRSSAFLIAEGVLPSNEGRGYVLRRIMRRAMRHAHLLGTKEPLMWQIVPVLISEMAGAYPELARAQSLITEVLKLEESGFQQMLERGLQILNRETATMTAGSQLGGDIAFKLYDTYGFPLDLTEDSLRGKRITVDHVAFDKAMARQRQKARASWSGSGADKQDKIWFDLRQQFSATEFLGYKTEVAEAKLLKLFTLDDNNDARYYAIFNQTPFYGESGGQMGDKGQITTADGEILAYITDTQKKAGDLFVHSVKLADSKEIREGMTVNLQVNRDRRQSLRCNHSSTHILHQALRDTLGSHVNQKGSLVAPERLRFDFSHTKPIDEADLIHIESTVNNIIRQNSPVVTHYMSLDDALHTGALALFGEKYADNVRVVTMGRKNGLNEDINGHRGNVGDSINNGINASNEDDNSPYSVELCGGTHVARTGEIGAFAIISETGVAAGIRRIEAITGARAIGYFNQQRQIVKQINAAIKSSDDGVVERITKLQTTNRRLENEIAKLQAQTIVDQAVSSAETIGDFTYVNQIINNIEAKNLRQFVDASKKRIASGVVIFIATSHDDKVNVSVGVTSDLTNRFNAAELAKLAAIELDGKGGGGRADFAQSGGKSPGKAAQTLQKLKEFLNTN